MIFARDDTGVRIEAAPGRLGYCPGCGEALIARCGEHRVWHWSHTTDTDCDPWWEAETAWHLAWKGICQPDQVEVAMGEHRADIVGVDGAVIELQHSSISSEEIRAREAFYGKMLWLIDGADIRANIRVELENKAARFTWAFGRPTWFAAHKAIFIHGFTIGTWIKRPDPKSGRLMSFWNPISTSDDVIQIKILKRRPIVAGTAKIIALEKFARRLLPLQSGADVVPILHKTPFAGSR